MARLNEAPAPADPVELLRRKYTRQNKDIARINSAQAVRIRNLENEVSRLLAENLELRADILNLQAGTVRSQHIVDHVGHIKSALDDKLRELGELVTRLEQPPPAPGRRSSVGSRLPRAVPKSPGQRQRELEELAEQEGRLPIILENKSFPRRTLDADEITFLLSEPEHNCSDSPDIGPPPVSHFMNEDPVKIDLPSSLGTNMEEALGLDPVLSVNLEQRRKRKDVAGSLDQKRPSRFEPPPTEETKAPPATLQKGAKRKFHMRDDDEIDTKQVAVVSPDDFKYTRKNVDDKPQLKESSISEKTTQRVTRELAVARARSKEKTAAGTSTAGRKPLAPKTVNSDVANSPKKQTKPPISDGEKPAKPPILRTTDSRPSSRNEDPMPIKPSVELVEPIVAIIPEPETPAALDIFSPTSSGPSTTRNESRDTPPPADLGPGGEGHRPSRRARASVSYAEPNLRDKMRRPTKELVDAVTGEGKGHRLSMSVKIEEDGQVVPQTENRAKQTDSTMRIKSEMPPDGESWKSMPISSKSEMYSNSPLSNKMADPASNSTAIPEPAQRRRRGSALYSTADPEDATQTQSQSSRSGSSNAISALIASQKAKQNSTPNPGDLADQIANLDIYEFTASSPKSENKKAGVGKTKEDLQKMRISRRQSTSMATVHKADDNVVQRLGTSAATRRRQNYVAESGGLAKVLNEGKEAVSASARSKEAGAGHQMSNSRTEIRDTEKEDPASQRSERLGARRRSMML